MLFRSDRDILRPVDLRGRKIATQKASSLHVFLHLFLLKEGLTESDVQLDFRAPDELANDLIAGKSDAAALREPQLSQVKAALGSNAVVFAERGLYVKYYLLVTRAAFLEQEPATVAAILRAVLAAEKAARANPAAAQTALAGKLQVTTAIAALLWPDMDLRVSLPQALVLCLCVPLLSNSSLLLFQQCLNLFCTHLN